MIDTNGATTVTRLLAAGTYSTSPTIGSGVDIRDYTGQVAIVVDAGAALAGSGAATLDVRIESSGTAAGVYSGVTSSGTFAQIPAAGGLFTLPLDTQQHQRYVRPFVTIGASGRFPVSVAIVGKKQNEP